MLVACAFASLLVLPVLFSLKCDGTMGRDSSWVAIWTPMWIVDFVQLLSAVLSVLLSPDPEGSSSSNNHEVDDPAPAQKVPLVDRLNNLSITVLFVLVQIFVLIRLDRVVAWSWFVTVRYSRHVTPPHTAYLSNAVHHCHHAFSSLQFIPWFLYEMLSVANEFQLAVMRTIARPHSESIGLMEDGPVGEEELFMLKIELENKYFEQVLLQQEARRHVIASMLRLWLAVFLALQLDHIVDWNWGVVLLPVWVYLCIQFGMAASYRSWGHRKMAGIDEEAVVHGEEKDPIKVVSFQQGSQLSSTSSLICLAQCGPLFMAVLLVCRLQPSSRFTTFIILLPIFALIGCCCCAVFCGICCLSCVDMDGLVEPPADSSSADRYSPPDPLLDVVTLGEVTLRESLPSSSHGSSDGSAVHAKASSSTQIDVDID